MEKFDFPLVWNDSLRSAYVSCPQAAYWEFYGHYKSAYPNVHLHAGKAWAGALEVARMAFYGDKLDATTAQALGLEALVNLYGDFQCPERGSGSNKSLDRLIEAFMYYFKAFPLETDPVQPYYGRNGKPMVEFNFVLPIDVDELRHPVSGEPILYAGRADMVATYAGAMSVYDDKTTSQLGPNWGMQWNRRSQFSAYAWAAREYGMPISQVIVRGIAILKTSINHQQYPTIRLPHHIEEWHFQVKRDIKKAIQDWKDGYFDKNLSDACASFGSCSFMAPCTSKNPDPWINGPEFQRRIWDPITREEIPIIPIVKEN